jgi:hypothetical protein
VLLNTHTKKSLSVCLKIAEDLHETHFETNEEDFLSDVADGDDAFVQIVLLSPGEFSLTFEEREWFWRFWRDGEWFWR